MKHAPEFLKIVNDAKTRIRETNVQEVKARLDAKEAFTLVGVALSRYKIGERPSAAL